MEEFRTRIMIENHLQYNFYPPLPLDFADVIVKTLPLIERAYFTEDYETQVDLGENLRINQSQYISLGEFVEFFHLEQFCPELSY